MQPLPIRNAEEYGSEEPEDFVYDDGALFAFMTIRERHARLHDVILKDKTKIGQRSGAGRAALQRMRPHFDVIVADGVGELPEVGGAPRYEEQLPWKFWRAMLADGLVDEVVLSFVGTSITRDMLDGPIETPNGTIEPEAVAHHGP